VDVPEIDVDELEALGEGIALIDVRQPDEFDEVRVPGAVLLPLGELVERLDEVPTDGPVYVICHSGGRSRKATEGLRSRGIDATNVAGGTQAWVDAGKPTHAGPQAG
jgi:rhodanese-related sulfurtransferase